MKTILISIAILFHSFIYGQNNLSTIFFDGHYLGNNIQMENPFSYEEVGYSIITIYVNDMLITDQINIPNIEIDFSKLSIELGDQVQISIKHKNNAMPKIINPEEIYMKDHI